MLQRPAVVVFDVNETLSDMGPMADRFTYVGAPPHVAKLWFTTLLRDGFALTAAGATEEFATVGREALRVLLASVGLDLEVREAVDHVMAGFGSLRVHADVADGVRALRAAGLRLVTLTNGSSQTADRLLSDAGLRDHFERLLSVADAGAWKPAPASYAYASDTCRVPPAQMVLIAVHPWDIDGAARAGMGTVWLNRDRSAYPGYFMSPTWTINSLTEAAGTLAP
jgi:2-haloacid dehalogenase